MANNLEYKVNGWNAHSGAGPKHNKFWLAEYRDGRQVSYLHSGEYRLTLFKTLDSAQRRADLMNA